LQRDRTNVRWTNVVGQRFAHADLKNVHSLEVDSLRSVYFDMKQKQAAESKKDATVKPQFWKIAMLQRPETSFRVMVRGKRPGNVREARQARRGPGRLDRTALAESLGLVCTRMYCILFAWSVRGQIVPAWS